MKTTKNFAEYIDARIANDPVLADAVENEAFNADLAVKIYEARTAANLNQKQLAEKIGTQQSVISRIEDADYSGHSVQLLRRIANALDLKLRVEFYAAPKRVEVSEFPVKWQRDSCQEEWQVDFESDQPLSYALRQ